METRKRIFVAVMAAGLVLGLTLPVYAQSVRTVHVDGRRVSVMEVSRGYRVVDQGRASFVAAPGVHTRLGTRVVGFHNGRFYSRNIMTDGVQVGGGMMPVANETPHRLLDRSGQFDNETPHMPASRAGLVGNETPH